MSFRVARVLCFCLWAAGGPCLRAAEPDVVISEFMAANRTTLRDRDGEYADWIELHNRGTNAVSLEGWFLTDNAASPRRWRVPAVTLLANECFLVFASEKNRTNPTAQLHTNFKLERGGEYLGLIRPDGVGVASEFAPAFPEQQDDVSYGRERTTPTALGYFAQPTPGAPNATSGPGFAPAVEFSARSAAFVDPLPLTLACPDPAAEIRYTLDGSLPGTSSLVYAGPLTITNRVQVRARAHAPGLLPGPVRTEAYLWIAPAMRNVSSDLPILVVDTFGRTVPETGDLRAHLWVFEPRGGRASLTNPPVLAARIVTDRRGSSTGGQPKPNLNVEVRDETDDDLNVELLGLPAESDWVLHAPYNFDPACFRNPLAYTLSREAGRYAPRHRFAEVYLNTGSGALAQSRYHGLYNVLERIKRGPDRVDVDRLGAADNAVPEVTGGYLFKIDRLGPGESGFSAGGQNFAYVDPREEVIRTPQRLPQRNHLTKYLNDLNTALNGASFADPVKGFPAFVDVPAAVDHHLLNTFFYNVDALRLSTFIHKPRAGLITWGPVWDFDRSLGSTDGRDAQPRGWNGGGGTEFFYYPWWNRMFQDTNFWQLWIDRWQELRHGPLANTNLSARIDAFNAEIAQAVPRDLGRWQQPKRGGSQAGEIVHLKRWLTNRADFIDTNFVRRPALSRPGGRITPGEAITLTGPTTATIWYTLDGTDPRAPGGRFGPSVRQYAGPINLQTTAVVRARAYNPGHHQRTDYPNPPVRSLWSGIATARFTTDRPAGPGDLAVTEINFHPPAPTPAELAAQPGLTEDDFEFIELKNVAPEPVDVFDLRFTEGIEFNFASNRVHRLEAGAHLLLVRNPAAFTLRHGLQSSPAGTFAGGLANTGERLCAADAAGRPVLDVTWRDDWQAAADGAGFTLVAREPGGVRPPWSAASHWRASALPGGSPGRADPQPPAVPDVVISELLTHTDPPLVDFVELHNAGDTPADLSGWLLSDRRDFSTAFTLPSGTVIPPRGFRVFDEHDFNRTPGAPDSFTFSSHGEEVWLAATDGAGGLLGPVEGFTFGAAANPVSFGRETNSVGEVGFVAQRALTPGAANSGPLPGAVVISEIHAAPASSWDAFVELKNVSATNVALFDPAAPTNIWRLDGLDAAFDHGFVLPPGGLLVLTAGEPTVFRQKFRVPGTVPVVGPWNGRLDADGERLTLLRPDKPDVDLAALVPVPEIATDGARFRHAAPWPAAGASHSLNRRDGAAPGDDPAAWFAAPPSPGAEWSEGGLAGWLARHFTPGERANAAVSGDDADADGDGLTNLGEFIAGTDPRDEASRLTVRAYPVNAGWLRLEVPVQPGRTYAVESRRASETRWSRWHQLEARSEPGVAALDEPAGAPGETRFFRVVTPAR